MDGGEEEIFALFDVGGAVPYGLMMSLLNDDVNDDVGACSNGMAGSMHVDRTIFNIKKVSEVWPWASFWHVSLDGPIRICGLALLARVDCVSVLFDWRGWRTLVELVSDGCHDSEANR